MWDRPGDFQTRPLPVPRSRTFCENLRTCRGCLGPVFLSSLSVGGVRRTESSPKKSYHRERFSNCPNDFLSWDISDHFLLRVGNREGHLRDDSRVRPVARYERDRPFLTVLSWLPF